MKRLQNLVMLVYNEDPKNMMSKLIEIKEEQNKMMSKLIETKEDQNEILSELIKSNQKEKNEEQKQFYEKAFEAINSTLSLIKEIRDNINQEKKNHN